MRAPLHFHLRGRREPFPSSSLWLWILDGIVMAAGIIGPLCTLPQIFLIYGGHQAAGVSAFSWGMYTLLDIPWIFYGFAHRERVIVYTYLLWLVANASVAIGAIVYA